VITQTKSSDQPPGGILYPLQRHNARLWDPGKKGVAVIESTAGKSRDQNGGHLLAENASDGFQATKMQITITGYLADLFPGPGARGIATLTPL
jgi:hypothetical protein